VNRKMILLVGALGAALVLCQGLVAAGDPVGETKDDPKGPVLLRYKPCDEAAYYLSVTATSPINTSPLLTEKDIGGAIKTVTISRVGTLPYFSGTLKNALVFTRAYESVDHEGWRSGLLMPLFPVSARVFDARGIAPRVTLLYTRPKRSAEMRMAGLWMDVSLERAGDLVRAMEKTNAAPDARDSLRQSVGAAIRELNDLKSLLVSRHGFEAVKRRDLEERARALQRCAKRLDTLKQERPAAETRSAAHGHELGALADALRNVDRNLQRIDWETFGDHVEVVSVANAPVTTIKAMTHYGLLRQ